MYDGADGMAILTELALYDMTCMTTLHISEAGAVDGVLCAAVYRVTLGTRARDVVHYSGPLRYRMRRWQNDGFADGH